MVDAGVVQLLVHAVLVAVVGAGVFVFLVSAVLVLFGSRLGGGLLGDRLLLVDWSEQAWV